MARISLALVLRMAVFQVLLRAERLLTPILGTTVQPLPTYRIYLLAHIR